MEIFRLFGTVSINKAKAMADISAVNAHAAKSSGTISKAFTAIGKAAKVAFTVAAAAAAVMFVKAIKSAAEFEQAMAMVKAVTGATAAEFAALTEKSKQLGRDTKFSMIEIADGMTALGRAGFTANEIISAMDGVTALAASQMIDLGAAAEITSNLIRGFGLEASEAERVANVLAATASSSNTTVQSLGESFKYIAPVAKQYGVSIEETASAIGILGNNGIQGTMATRSLSTALIGLAAPTKEAQETMDALGISMFDSEGNFIGLNAAVGELERGFEGLTAQEKAAALSSIVGAEALKHFSILVDEGEAALNDYTGELTGTTAAFDQMAIQLDTLEGQWTIMKGSVSLLFQTLGESLMPVLKNLLRDHIIPLINRTQQWVEAMGGIRGMIGHALIAVGEYIKGVAEWIRSHENLSDGIDALWEVFKGLLSFIKNVFKGDWSAVWEDIKTIAANAFEAIVSLAAAAWEALPIPDRIKSAIETSAKAIFDAVVSVFGWIIDNKDHVIAGIAGIGAAFLALKVPAALAGIAAGLEAMKAAALLALGPAGWIALLIAGVGYLAVRTIQKWDEIKKAGVGHWAGIIGLPTDAQWASWATRLWEGFYGMLPTDAQWASWSKAFLIGLMHAIGDIPQYLYTVGKAFVVALIDGMISAVNGIAEIPRLLYDSFSRAWGTFVDGIVGLLPSWMQRWLGFGESAADGLIKGMKDREKAVATAVDDLANTAITTMQDALRSHSPSEVTREFGHSYGDGLILGMTEKGEALIAAGQRILDNLKAEQEKAAADAGTSTGETYTEETANALSAGAADVAAAAGEVTAALTAELSELLKALTEAEHGSYEYAKALKDLQKFHEDLVKAAEYLESQNIEVSDSLLTLIAQTKAYADRQEEVNEVVEKTVGKMGELQKSYADYVQIMAEAEVGTVAYAEGLQGVQSLSDSLIDTVDFLEAHNVAVSESIWDLIDALESQGAETKKTAREIDKLAEETEAAEKETQRLKDAQEAAERAAEDHKNEIKSLAREFYGLAKNAIRDVINAYKSMREEAEAYAESVAEINEDFRRNELDLDERLSQDKTDEATRHARELEDIERDHQRRVEEIRAEEYEDKQDMLDKLAEEEIDYLQDLEDETIKHTRELADLQTDYTRETKENAEDRIEAIQEEGDAYEENRTRIGDAIIGIGKDILSYLGDKAITAGIDTIAASIAGVGTAAETAATATGTAMTNMAGAISSATPGITSALGSITSAIIRALPFLAVIGFGLTDPEKTHRFGQQLDDQARRVFGIPETYQDITMTDGDGNKFKKDEEGNWVPFAKGAIFNRPTLLPAHTVAEAGVSEAYIPLSKGVLGQIGEGIVNAITPQSPVLAGAGGINIDMRGMYDGAQITVRNDSDIEALARANYDLMSSRLRAEGRRI